MATKLTSTTLWTKEYYREYAKGYYQQNKERIRQYYYNNRSYFLAYKREHNRKNRESILLKNRINYRIRTNKRN